MDEEELLTRLDAEVWRAIAAGRLDAAIRRVTAALARDAGLRLAWEALPLHAYDTLPETIRSSWVFVLRGGTTTGAERHPNSIQRVMSYRGRGDLQTWDGGGWQSSVLSSARDTPLAGRWLTIPANVWHRPVMPQGAPWLVVSFHTAAADSLIEERPLDDERPDAEESTSELYAGRRAR